jgi:hypothetical protein
MEIVAQREVSPQPPWDIASFYGSQAWLPGTSITIAQFGLLLHHN